MILLVLMNFFSLFLLKYVQLQNYQSMLHFQNSHVMLSNEFLLIHTRLIIYAPSFILDKLFLK